MMTIAQKAGETATVSVVDVTARMKLQKAMKNKRPLQEMDLSLQSAIRRQRLY